MRLSVSNIAWAENNAERVYYILRELGFSGIEIAPTRLWKEKPYSHLREAQLYRNFLKDKYGLAIVSMQSIWFGRNEKIWGSKEEREVLIRYTKSAIEFAEAIGCSNLVFGCPRNRVIPLNGQESIAIDFFREVGEYAAKHNVIIALEANPAIYNTNFMNKTEEAFRIAKSVGSNGCKVNLDFGTVIENAESLDIVQKNIGYINHVHISEPGLKVIQRRAEHEELRDILVKNEYSGFVSIEMGNGIGVDDLFKTMKYVKDLFS